MLDKLVEKLPGWLFATALVLFIVLLFFVRSSGEKVTFNPLEFIPPNKAKLSNQMQVEMINHKWMSMTVGSGKEVAQSFSLPENCTLIGIDLPIPDQDDMYFGTSSEKQLQVLYPQFKAKNGVHHFRVWLINNNPTSALLKARQPFILILCANLGQ